MSHSVLHSKHVVEFLTVSGEFVKFAENPPHQQREQFVSIALKLLSLLYLKALFLEKQEIEQEDENDFEFVSLARYEKVKNKAEQLLGDADVYVALYDTAMMNSQDYVNISLSELWADIFQDIANFSEAMRIGEDNLMRGAVAKCVENFESFWGVRLVTLISHLHRLMFIEQKYNNDEV